MGSILHWNYHGDIRNVRLENGHGWAVYSVLVQMLDSFQYQGYMYVLFQQDVQHMSTEERVCER